MDKIDSNDVLNTFLVFILMPTCPWVCGVKSVRCWWTFLFWQNSPQKYSLEIGFVFHCAQCDIMWMKLAVSFWFIPAILSVLDLTSNLVHVIQYPEIPLAQLQHKPIDIDEMTLSYWSFGFLVFYTVVVYIYYYCSSNLLWNEGGKPQTFSQGVSQSKPQKMSANQSFAYFIGFITTPMSIVLCIYSLSYNIQPVMLTILSKLR